QPSGVETAELRLVTVISGVVVAVIGSALLWPRGAKPVVGTMLGAYFRQAARYLDLATYAFVSHETPAGLDHAVRDLGDHRRPGDDAVAGLVTEGQTAPDELAAWARLLCIPGAVRQVAAVIAGMTARGYPSTTCEVCAPGVDALDGELDRVEAALERSAS